MSRSCRVLSGVALLFATSQAFAIMQATTRVQSSALSGENVHLVTKSKAKGSTNKLSQLGLYAGTATAPLEIRKVELAQTTPAAKGTKITLSENTDASGDAKAESTGFSIAEAAVTGSNAMGSCNVTAGTTSNVPVPCGNGANSFFPAKCIFRCYTKVGTACPSESEISASGTDYTIGIVSSPTISVGSVSTGSTRCCYLKNYDHYCETGQPLNGCNGDANHHILINTTTIKGVRASGGFPGTCTNI
jgi:hypothetical protein